MIRLPHNITPDYSDCQGIHFSCKLPSNYNEVWLIRMHFEQSLVINYEFHHIIVTDDRVYYFSWPLGVCLFVLLLYVPSQQLWSLRDGQFT